MDRISLKRLNITVYWIEGGGREGMVQMGESWSFGAAHFHTSPLTTLSICQPPAPNMALKCSML